MPPPLIFLQPAHFRHPCTCREHFPHKQHSRYVQASYASRTAPLWVGHFYWLILPHPPRYSALHCLFGGLYGRRQGIPPLVIVNMHLTYAAIGSLWSAVLMGGCGRRLLATLTSHSSTKIWNNTMRPFSLRTPPVIQCNLVQKFTDTYDKDGKDTFDGVTDCSPHKLRDADCIKCSPQKLNLESYRWLEQRQAIFAAFETAWLEIAIRCLSDEKTDCLF